MTLNEIVRILDNASRSIEVFGNGTKDDVKKQYKKYIKICHPDLYQNDQKDLASKAAILLNEYYEDKYVHCTVQNYSIDVDNSIKTYSEIYEPLISNKRKVLK